MWVRALPSPIFMIDRLRPGSNSIEFDMFNAKNAIATPGGTLV